MSGPLEDLYFNWLSSKVTPTIRNPTPSQSYSKLLYKLYTTEFVWLLSGDDNRAEDGKELRIQFLLEADIPDDPEWRAIGCSVLEMLIAFSKRAEFMTDTPAHEWFWEFLDNLGIRYFVDAAYNEEVVEELVYRFVWRIYTRDGTGGLFPLNTTRRDQKKVEIWYQFCDYLVDQDRLP